MWKFTGKVPYANLPTPVLCEPAQSKRTSTLHKSHFVWTFTRKMALARRFFASLRSRNAHGHFTRSTLWTDPNPAASILCEPAQSKYTRTCHKSRFVWKFTGKMPHAPATTSIERQASTLTVGIPQCGHTVWGKCFFPQFVMAANFGDNSK